MPGFIRAYNETTGVATPIPRAITKPSRSLSLRAARSFLQDPARTLFATCNA
jgi:hypothetical protein